MITCIIAVSALVFSMHAAEQRVSAEFMQLCKERAYQRKKLCLASGAGTALVGVVLTKSLYDRQIGTFECKELALAHLIASSYVTDAHAHYLKIQSALQNHPEHSFLLDFERNPGLEREKDTMHFLAGAFLGASLHPLLKSSSDIYHVTVQDFTIPLTWAFISIFSASMLQADVERRTQGEDEYLLI